MIYENEELRLRTININAEVERGRYCKIRKKLLEKRSEKQKGIPRGILMYRVDYLFY